jgi:hypothetical protein
LPYSGRPGVLQRPGALGRPSNRRPPHGLDRGRLCGSLPHGESSAVTAAGAVHTLPDHRPPAHRAYLAGWNPDQGRTEAAAIGPQTRARMEAIIAHGGVPESIQRRCPGILRCAARYGPALLEQAAAPALAARTYSVAHVEAYGAAARHPTARPTPPDHANSRGAAYFQHQEETVQVNALDCRPPALPGPRCPGGGMAPSAGGSRLSRLNV